VPTSHLKSDVFRSACADSDDTTLSATEPSLVTWSAEGDGEEARLDLEGGCTTRGLDPATSACLPIRLPALLLTQSHAASTRRPLGGGGTACLPVCLPAMRSRPGDLWLL
jgi:hypothetical protein